MRLVTWNLNGRVTEPTWSYIDRALGADVAFVQEAVNPQGTDFPVERWLWTEIGENTRFGPEGRYRWATGIRAASGTLQMIDTRSICPGWVVAANHEVNGRVLTLVNAHIEIDETATRTLNRVTSELEELLRGEDVILGGDLNVDRLIGEVYRTNRHAEALDRLEALGLFHINTLLPKGTRTYLKSEHPYQDDHFFVSGSLREAVEDVSVLVGSRVDELSDHCPLILDLRV